MPQLQLNMRAATKNITFQDDKPSLRVTSDHVCASLLRKQSDFAFLEAQNCSDITTFLDFQHVVRATGAPMQTLVQLELFLYPMDRAKVLHKQT